jgi:hypothetical protein
MNLNRKYSHDRNMYGSGGINVGTQFQPEYPAAGPKADPVQPAILWGFSRDLILYLKRLKFPKPGHLSVFT